jgi:predicted Ser/Thr protein kinase
MARQATGGGLETWSRLGGSGSDRFRHEVIRYKSNAWTVQTSEDVAADTVPRERDSTTF